MDKKSIIVSICCSLVITGIAAFMVHSNLTEDINLIGRSAQARTARLERDTEESLSSYQSGIEDNYLNISNSYEYIDTVRNGIQNDISILRAEMNRVQETLNSSFADLSASVNAGQTATIETQARLGNIAEDLYQLSMRIDELEQEVEKLRKDIWEYKRHARGLGNGIWFVSDYMIANIRGEFNDYYHTWMRVRQGEFEFENERKSRD